MGPSHHVRLNGCALTQTVEYETPFYNLIIDHESNNLNIENNNYSINFMFINLLINHLFINLKFIVNLLIPIFL